MRYYIYGLLMVGALGWAGAADSETEAGDNIQLRHEGLEILMEGVHEADAKAGKENTLSPESRDEMRASLFNPTGADIDVADYKTRLYVMGGMAAGWSSQDSYMSGLIGFGDDNYLPIFSPIIDLSDTTWVNWADTYDFGTPDGVLVIEWDESSLEGEGAEVLWFNADMEAVLN